MQQAQSTASSWHSFDKALMAVLRTLNPKTVFEYGPGMSTSLMALYPSVEVIDSVEHNLAWYNKYKWEMPENVNLIYQPELVLYPTTKGRVESYDLFFVDGREREICLFLAKERLNEGGVVILHDAERPNYKDMINSYKFKFWQDEGHTCVLTDYSQTAMRLEGAFE